MYALKFSLFSFLIALGAIGTLPAQDIQTAAAFFDSVSQRYGEITDYSASITITNDEQILFGDLYYATPNRIRIDFEEPTGQVLVSNGEVIQVYIPRYNVVLQQSLRRRSEEALATLVNEQGLNLIRENYSIAYLDDPGLVPLEEDSDELVTRLRFNWRSPSEGYRQLDISVSEDLLIRRIVGVTANYREVQFDFEDIVINQGIPETRFEYEAPSSANLFNNFLFEGDG